MASETRAIPTRDWRVWLTAAWVFGCAAYYYLHFAAVFLRENETAFRRAFPATAETFLSQPSAR